MLVDPKKVSLNEADVEQYLWEHPGIVRLGNVNVDHWIKRQYSVPSGIIDLFGITTNGNYVVAEVKNVEVDAKAIAQVCRYAFDLDEILSRVDEHAGIYYPGVCAKVLIGPSISTTVLREIEACEITYIQFDVTFHLEISRRQWTDDFLEARTRTYEELALDGDLADSHRFYQARWDEFQAYLRQMTEESTEDEDTTAAESDIDTEDVPF